MCITKWMFRFVKCCLELFFVVVGMCNRPRRKANGFHCQHSLLMRIPTCVTCFMFFSVYFRECNIFQFVAFRAHTQSNSEHLWERVNSAIFIIWFSPIESISPHKQEQNATLFRQRWVAFCFATTIRWSHSRADLQGWKIRMPFGFTHGRYNRASIIDIIFC